MLCRIDRGLVGISKDGRLIPPRRKTRQEHNRTFQTFSCRADKSKMSFFPQTMREWKPISPDIPEDESLYVFTTRVSLATECMSFNL